MHATEAEVSGWIRYYDRRRAEGFGSASDLFEVRRAQVIDYIRGNCAEAAARLKRGESQENDAG